MPYGQAYRGLPRGNLTPKPVMLQLPAKQALHEGDGTYVNTSWRRAYGRTMQRLTEMAQRWKRVTKSLQSTIVATAEKLIDWYQENANEAATGEVDLRNDAGIAAGDESEHDEEPIELQLWTQLSKPAQVKESTSMPHPNLPTHVSWATHDGVVVTEVHESKRTHYMYTKGKRPQRHKIQPRAEPLQLQWVIAKAKQRARRRADRNQKQLAVWDTAT